MPIYDYQCGQCASDFELLVRGDEKPVCPSCNSKKLKKKISLAAAPQSGANAGPGSANLGGG